MPIQADRIASGLAAPLFAASPPGDPNRFFVLEKNSGRVVILDLTTNQVSAQPFFDVPAADLSIGSERGLLGMAFHPDYVTNGKLYLNLTNELGDTEIWELTRSGDPNVADPASMRVLMTIDRTNPNHNGGWIGFGPDGHLYIATGDSGEETTPKMLRRISTICAVRSCGSTSTAMRSRPIRAEITQYRPIIRLLA